MTFFPKALGKQKADNMYLFLRDKIEWEEGVPTRSGEHTRSAKKIDIRDWPQLEKFIQELLLDKYNIHGVYLNYLKDKNDYVPQHRHPNTIQLIISLGATRTLKVKNKIYQMTHGSAILFGDELHGVSKSPHDVGGRISIATFMTKI